MDHVHTNLSDFRVDVFVKADWLLSTFTGLPTLRKGSQVFIELIIGNFVAFFILPILLAMFLDCVVGEVDIRVVVFIRVLEGSSSNVSIFIEVSLNPSQCGTDHNEMPNIELPALIQKRFLYVFLDDIAEGFPICVAFLILDDGFNFVQILADSDTRTTITHFSWLHDPCCIALFFAFPVILRKEFQEVLIF